MDAASSPPFGPTPTSLATRVRTLLLETRELARDHLELAALEAQRASAMLARILVAAVVISILVVTTWLALVAGGLVWATDAGVSWPVALLLAAAINLALAGGLGWYIRSHVGELLFEATLRQLRRSADEAKDVTGNRP
jgi:uncharacterized membrane protein YqjE